MSDDNSPVVEEQKKKRGRPAKADKNAVKEPKKRGRPAAEKNNAVRPAKSDNEDDAPPGPVKKGRGRPKGSHKKKVRRRIRNIFIEPQIIILLSVKLILIIYFHEEIVELTARTTKRHNYFVTWSR